MIELYDLQCLSLSDAMRLIQAVIQLASNDGGKPVAACVLDIRRVQLAAACMDGASEANVRTAHAKAVTALEFQRDTRDFRFNPDGSIKEDGWPDHHVVNALGINPEFCSFAGGVEITADCDDCDVANVVGTIAISGRAELDDDKLAREAIELVISSSFA